MALKSFATGRSLLAVALLDTACLLQDREIYNGLRKDILAVNVVPHYYQAADTVGQFEYAATDIVRFPNVEFMKIMPAFEAFVHDNHLNGEVRPKLASAIGDGAYVATSLLMRDRWFPRLWIADITKEESASSDS